MKVFRLGRTTVAIFKSNPLFYSSIQRSTTIDRHQLFALCSTQIRSFHRSSIVFDDKSKIEKTVDLLKDKVEGEKVKAVTAATPPEKTVATVTSSTESVAVKRKSLWERIVHELKHYYNGFKLLFIETKIAFRLLRQVLNDHTLTRRERKQVRFRWFFDLERTFSLLVHSNGS